MLDDTSNRMLAAALSYVRRGWGVFPLRPEGELYKSRGVDMVSDGKVPATAHGHKDATTDPAQINKWWGGRPDWNIGLATTPQGGVWVLDCDIDKETGEDGRDTLDELRKEHGSIPPHPIAITPSGGEHHFFAWPADGQDVPRRIRFQPGLDALGQRASKGGYVVLSPSVRSSGEYQWQLSPDVVSAPQAPAWLLELIRRNSTTRPPDLDSVKPVKNAATSKYGRAALRELCAEISGASPGQQEITLVSRAVRVGSLAYGGNIAIDEAFSHVISAASKMVNTKNREPWTLELIEKKVRSAFAHAENDPTPPPTRNVPAPSERDAPLTDDGPHDPPVDLSEAYGADPREGDDTTTKERQTARVHEPFRYLGYNREFYFYLPDGKTQIVSLRASEHTPLRMLEIAPMDFWLQASDERMKLSKEQWLTLADSMMRRSEVAGIFDATWVRGRGAWIDRKQVVVHTGSEAIVDGQPMALQEIKSKFVYERGAPWDFGFGEPASNRDAHQLVKICEGLTWADPLSGALLAGWNIIAPVCGALRWRPHIWITGPSGSGKTTALNDIVMRVAGPAGKRFDGKTTEASVRQLMGNDARPVILDEAESEDVAAVQRMQGLLDLARVASSGGEVAKGGQNHKAVIFVVRSCFCFSSINTAVRYRADESRISKLVLVPNRAPDADAKYQELVKLIASTFTAEYAGAMFQRTVKLLPTLLKNCETFEAAAAIHFKSRRSAEQIGPMLAGYYLCHNKNEVSLDEATEFIARHEWGDYIADTTGDEMRCFEFLMSRTIRINAMGMMVETTIGQALERASTADSRLDPYVTGLGSRGIKYEDGMIGVSDSSEVTRALFKEQPQWQADWKSPLRNLPGATRSASAVRFSPGVQARATWVPFAHLSGSYIPREPGAD